MKKPRQLKLLLSLVIFGLLFLVFGTFFGIVALDNWTKSRFDFQRFPPETVSGYVQSYRELVTGKNCSVYLYVDGEKFYPWLLSCKDAHKLKGAYVRIHYSRELDTEVGLEIGAEKVFGIDEWKEARFNGFLSMGLLVLLFGVLASLFAWALIFWKQTVIHHAANRPPREPADRVTKKVTDLFPTNQSKGPGPIYL